MSRTEVISLVIRMTLLSTCAYFGTRWLIGQIDPTSQQKKRSKETVIYQLSLSLCRSLINLYVLGAPQAKKSWIGKS